MQRFIWATSYVAGGLALGCFSAYALIQSSGIEHVESGTPWLSRATAMADTSAFYVRSHYLMEGRLPPAPGQLTEATAETDSENRPLTSSCVYRVAGSGPLPRWWSLTATGSDVVGAPLQSTADSDTALREADGSVLITVSSLPRPGNWLKAPEARRFSLLYSAIPQGAGVTTPPFTITREACP
jgi:hypothetical protein